MTAQTLTPTDFLLARIAEEEAWAHTLPLEGYMKITMGDHARRVLAECEAKRRIVAATDTDSDHRLLFGGCEDDCEWKALEYAVKHLATPYADHPDYREEWKP